MTDRQLDRYTKFTAMASRLDAHTDHLHDALLAEQLAFDRRALMFLEASERAFRRLGIPHD